MQQQLEPARFAVDATDAPPGVASTWQRIAKTVRGWIDTDAIELDSADADRIDWLRTMPFVAMHLACVAVVWLGVSPVAVAVAVALYAIRMFALTGFYHRYFSHKTFKTSRAMQFVFALIGASSVQRARAASCSCTSLRTAPRCIRSRPRARTTGWAGTSSPAD